jgi:hypothetical protein
MINIRWQHIAILVLTSWLVACSTPTQLSAPHPDLQGAATPSIASRVVSDGIGSECNLPPDSGRPQYIIGYGSLMQDESRKRTSPQAGPAHPVDIRGYRRGWFARAEAVGFGTTYLGVLPSRESHLNAVIYQVEVTEVIATDQREISYCRTVVAMSDIKPLEREFLLAPDGQIWIYVGGPQSVATPDLHYPIVQSYVDIFLSGCLEQEQRFGLTELSQRCLSTTADWSEHWVNDCIIPAVLSFFSREQVESITYCRSNCHSIFLASR